MKLTVFFDEGCRFWIGVVEQEEEGRLRAYRHIFGSEPKDAEVLAFIRSEMMERMRQTQQSAESGLRSSRRVSPKRLARQAAKELGQRGVSTLAQQAIKLELESRKRMRKVLTRQQVEEQNERKYQLRVQKAKLKHKGR
ncbi:YjdF family protein [Paenibacillus sp. GD4]|jgi:hypothetical protein|uniref:YjdF family protein n=1 Tax=Paenibacillus sp. GD4 TaxID=3068890 RepID=UPI002796DE54|nr:YjdF family protein [Paenibacillus sp. GD4]MDQ1911080.1 YjdF family protein [Paenibacillus sp. GD4]